MRIRAIVLCVLANATALAAGFFFLRHSQMAEVQKEAARLKEKEMSLAPAKAPPPPEPPVVVFKTNRFDWAQVESGDYRQYIANLRSIGCPEATIRDLIMTDVMRLYAARRGQFYHNGREFKYWETNEKRALKPKQLAEREKQLALIDKELPRCCASCWASIMSGSSINILSIQMRMTAAWRFSPSPSATEVLALRDQFEGKRERLLELAKNGPLSDEQARQLRQIESERTAALAQVLTPEEREQYACTSETADRLRKELVGFNPTEKEFRQIFARQQAGCQARPGQSGR